MGGKTGRNDPCHCGSGKKYKNCHWSEDQSAGVGSSGSSAVSAGAEASANGWNRNHIALGLFLAVVGGGIVLAVMGHWDWAIAVGGAGSLLVGILWVSMDPPPPSDKGGNPSGLNFGS